MKSCIVVFQGDELDSHLGWRSSPLPTEEGEKLHSNGSGDVSYSVVEMWEAI